MLVSLGGWFDDAVGGVVKVALLPITIPIQATATLVKATVPVARDVLGLATGTVRDVAGALRPPPPPPPGPSADAFTGGGTGGTGSLTSTPAAAAASDSSYLPIILGGVAAAGLVGYALWKGKKGARS